MFGQFPDEGIFGPRGFSLLKREQREQEVEDDSFR